MYLAARPHAVSLALTLPLTLKISMSFLQAPFLQAPFLQTISTTAQTLGLSLLLCFAGTLPSPSWAQSVQAGLEKAQKGDYAGALKAWQPLADSGDAQAQNNLGSMYFNGYGVEQDDAKAVQWWLKAAQQGHADAQDNLGRMYELGRGVKRDRVKARQWYAKARDGRLSAAQKGDAQAQFALGMRHFVGNGVNRNHVRAADWFLKAAQQGHLEAHFYLGWVYEDGFFGVKRDEARAHEWYLKAAQQGHDHAQYRLGRMYAEGMGVPQDHAQARQWWLKAAQQGSDYAQYEAQYHLGQLYAKGLGVPKDESQVLSWWLKAAQNGSFMAGSQLGKMYAKGGAHAQEITKFFAQSHAAAQQNDAQAQYNLSWMYAYGAGVERDDTQALQWAGKAAAQGHAPAQSQKASLERRAEERAAAQAVSNKRISDLVARTERGDVKARYMLGEEYLRGGDVKKDEAQAVAWFFKAAQPQNLNDGNVEKTADQEKPELKTVQMWNDRARSTLGTLYANDGKHAPEITKIFEQSRSAAQQGDAHAQFTLGWMYEYGAGVERDYVKALAWTRKAAAQGHAPAQSQQANQESRAEERAAALARAPKRIKALQTAAEDGHAHSQYMLGRSYWYGDSGIIKKDRAKAVEWFQQAAQQGHIGAKEALRNAGVRAD